MVLAELSEVGAGGLGFDEHDASVSMAAESSESTAGFDALVVTSFSPVGGQGTVM
jgi:hypothetical protein